MWRVPPDVSASRNFPRVEIRLVRSHDEFAACEAMSRDIWGAAERNVVPRELLRTIQLNGGLVHGAFAADDRLVGSALPFSAGATGSCAYAPINWASLRSFRAAASGSRSRRRSGPTPSGWDMSWS